jgi:mycothiol system anti-sigma-R factor
MACERSKEQLYLYLDGELAPSEALEFKQHLRTCLPCQQEATRHQRLRTLLRTTLAEEEVPLHLWTSIQHQLERENTGEVQLAGGRTRWPLWSSLVTVAALLLVTFMVRLWFLAPQAPVVQEIVDSQIRARLAGMPYNPMAADSRIIRQWFQDKVEFAVLVPDLPQERYMFLGARVDYFLGRRVAELAYATDTYRLSLVMFLQKDLDLAAIPAVREGTRTLHVQQYKGYTTVLWKDGDILCGLISDLPRKALLPIARQVTGSALSS